MPLAENDDVVKAFPPDRTDQPFSICVLPRGARRRRSIANAHRSNSSYKNIAVSPIAIADQLWGSLFPAACFHDLIYDPFCARMRCDSKPYNLSPPIPHDQQAVEQSK